MIWAVCCEFPLFYFFSHSMHRDEGVSSSSSLCRSLTSNSFTILGWLVTAPSPEDCTTGHRYLRSPVDGNLYLGGPISLGQFSKTPTVRCQRALNHPGVQVTTVCPLEPGSDVKWTYFKNSKKKVDAVDGNAVDPVNFLFSIKEWQLVRHSCEFCLFYVLLCTSQARLSIFLKFICRKNVAKKGIKYVTMSQTSSPRLQVKADLPKQCDL